MSTDTTSGTPLRQRMIEDMAARNLGRHSQRSHIHSCKRFAAWLKRSPETATADDVRLFQLHLIESGASICNRNRIMTGVKFLLKVTMRRHDLAAEIYHLGEPKKVPLVLAADEVKRILVCAPSVKAKVMLSISYGCGLRAGEVVRLKVGDIDSAQMIIRVEQGKGRKDRNVMLPPDVLALLRQWWPQRTNKYDLGVPVDRLWLFPGRNGGLHVTARQYSRLFQEAAVAAGIRKPVTLHTLRHCFATHLLERGIDIRIIQAVLGHDKLDTTARYTRVATGLISKVESPLESLDGRRRGKHPRKQEPPAK